MAVAVILGLVLIPLAARWLAEIEWVRYSDNATTQALFPHSIAILVVLTALSAALRRIAPNLAFRRKELLICYILVSIGSHLGGHDMLQVLYSSIAHVVHQARPENNYAGLFLPTIPSWALPSEGQGLSAFYEGQSSLSDPANWASWRAPVLTWAAFTMVSCLVMFAGANLLRRQWENERLNYPLAQVPLRLTRGDGAAMLGRMFLIGVAIGILPTLFNTLKHFYPSFPGIPVQVKYYQLNEAPWSAFGSFPVCFFPFAYGLTYLIPTDLAFSCWFFHIFTGLTRVFFHWRGFTQWQGFPYVDQQATGAHLGLAVLVFYNARRHLRFVLREIRKPDATRGTEALSYRVSAGLLALGLPSMIWWVHAMGLGWGGAAVWVVLFLAIVLAVSRLRAEYGLPTNELFRKGPEWIMTSVAGTRSFGRAELTGLGIMNWLTRTHRQFPMQVQTDMLEVGKKAGLDLRKVGSLIVVATLIGIFSAKWALLDVSMRTGVATAKVQGPAMWAFGPEPWNSASGWINNPTLPDFKQLGAYLYGIFFCFVLYRLRISSANFPLHPGGYVMSCTFGLARLWVPLFSTWCFKSLTLRYGGHKLYLHFMPLFLGLIVGEYTAAVVRTLIDLGWSLYLPSESGIGGL